MTVRVVRIWTCDVGGCDERAEKQVVAGHQGDDVHDLPIDWVSIRVNAIRGHHNVTKWLCPEHALAHVYPMFPEYAPKSSDEAAR